MFDLPKLSYKYNELAKFVSTDALRLHYEKHHQAYLDKLNIAIEGNERLSAKSIDEILVDVEGLPVTIRQAVIDFGGGYYNHNFFWNSLSPSGGGEPSGHLAELLIKKYGSYESFVERFTSLSLSVFGSGWSWLLSNGDIVTTPNQNTTLCDKTTTPLLCLDLWEHAYYLDYKNRRDEYIKSWWNVVNWSFAEANYTRYLGTLE